MRQIFPQIEPPKKSFMERAGWPIVLVIATLIGTIIGAAISAIILGTTHVIDFSWLVLILIFVMLIIMGFCVWYIFRNKWKFQEQYNADIADIRKDALSFKNDIRQMREEETRNWNAWAISFSQQADKEHKDRTEELKQQCMETIADAENRMSSRIKNTETVFSGAVDSFNRSVDLYGQQLIHAQRQMETLEEKLREKLSPPENTEQSSE